MQDEWNNLYYLGEYNALDDAIPDINDFLSVYNVKLEKGELVEYASTFNSCFDLDISGMERYEDREDIFGIMVRGFVLYKDEEGEKKLWQEQ